MHSGHRTARRYAIAFHHDPERILLAIFQILGKQICLASGPDKVGPIKSRRWDFRLHGAWQAVSLIQLKCPSDHRSAQDHQCCLADALCACCFADRGEESEERV